MAHESGSAWFDRIDRRITTAMADHGLTLLRLAVGPDHRLLLPASALLGASLLVTADLGARLAGGIPVGVVTAFVGAPFFLWLLRRSRRVSTSVSP